MAHHQVAVVVVGAVVRMVVLHHQHLDHVGVYHPNQNEDHLLQADLQVLLVIFLIVLPTRPTMPYSMHPLLWIARVVISTTSSEPSFETGGRSLAKAGTSSLSSTAPIIEKDTNDNDHDDHDDDELHGDTNSDDEVQVDDNSNVSVCSIIAMVFLHVSLLVTLVSPGIV
jgi:hypothetical protein